MTISRKELYFYSFLLFLMPVSVVFSGQITVIFLALLSLVPLAKFAFSSNLNLRDLIISNDRNINYLSLTICIFLLCYALFTGDVNDNIITLTRIAIMLIAFKSLYLYLPNLSTNSKVHLQHSLELGFILAVLVFIIEFNTNASLAKFLTESLHFERAKFGRKQLFTMNRGACFLTMIFWSIIIANKNNYKKYAFYTLSLLPVLYCTGSQTAQLAFIICNLFFGFCFFFPNFIKKYFFLIFILLNMGLISTMYLISPIKIGLQTNMPHSFIHRICIWKYTSELTAKNPFGYGLDISQAPLYTDKEDKELCIPDKLYPKVREKIHYHISHHPHYQLLQIIFELGMAAGLLYLIACYLCLKKIFNINNLFHRNSALSLFLTIFMIGLTGFGIWQNWLIASYLLSISLFQLFKENTISQ